jgi:hypothetical protein
MSAGADRAVKRRLCAEVLRRFEGVLATREWCGGFSRKGKRFEIAGADDSGGFIV